MKPTSAATVAERVRLFKRSLVFEYIGGPHPYVWIGTRGGEFLAAIDVSELREFLKEGRENG